ncbi:MAG: aminotransferase class V-fold PLP-dependent enzyme, partial [Oscillospiraceae bacterium]
MREIYLDNSATTKVDSRVAQLALDIMVNNYGNPSSLHKLGLKAELAIEKARNQIAAALSCDANCLFFTSGGTEANNTAILGACEAQKRRGNKIITTSFEHSSVIASFQELEKRGFEAKYISP